MPDFDVLAVIDFETYYASDYTLSKMTTESYVRDPRFETIGVGVKMGDEKAWFEDHEFRAWAKQVDWSRTAVLAHHAHFDLFILSHHYDIRPAFIIDTLSMARIFVPVDVGGSLAKLARYFGVGEKGDEVVKAFGKRRKDFTREEWLKYGEYCLLDCELTEAIGEKMSDGVPEDEMLLIGLTVRAFTEPVFVGDQQLLQQFIVDEQKRKQDLLDRVAKDKSVLMSNDKFAQLLIELGEDPPMKISPALTKTARRKAAEAGIDPATIEPVETYAFAKSDVGMQVLLEHERDEIRWVAEARVGVKSTINETRAQRLLGMAQRGAMPISLKYAGAHTYRFSGMGRVNFQNLPRGCSKHETRVPDCENCVKGTLRAALLAPPGGGMKVVVADSGQIEARVLAWLAGHDALTQMFARSIVERTYDVYSEVGSELFGQKISKDETPLERQVSKNLCLGLGFGMGWYKLSQEMAKGMLGSKPITFDLAWVDRLNVDLGRFTSYEPHIERVRTMPSRLPIEQRVVHCAVAQHLVNWYRHNNQPITDFWELCTDVIERMLEIEPGMGESFGANDCLIAVRHGIQLPNGLTLRYNGLRKSESEDGDERAGYSYMGGPVGKERKKIYSGLLTENVVQALARVIVFQQSLAVYRKWGYRWNLCSHDELVYVVPDAEANICLERVLAEMRTPPAWAPGLPVTAEGAVGQTYGDCK